MTALTSDKNTKAAGQNNLFKDYSWFWANIFQKVKKASLNFFQKDFEFRFMGISLEDNILFYGDEYFVNKIPVTKNSDIKVKISGSLVSFFLDNALGLSENPFTLSKLTDIEAMLIKSYTAYLYKNIEESLNKAEMSKKTLQNSKDYNITFFVRNNKQHEGTIIITIQGCIIPDIEPEKDTEHFSISDFKTAPVNVSLCVGTAKTALNDIKNIEDGDIIVLDNSDINNMYVQWGENKVKFRINPNPSLIINIDNNGGNEMEEETSAKSQNMWDSILVDIIAEFDNVKLTLGELKQISEGLVIDVGSVYDNKIKLRVENQIIATGELVILNDRYGVRIESVKKSKETPKPEQKASAPQKPSATQAANQTPAAKQTAKPAAAKQTAANTAARPAAKPAATKQTAANTPTQNNADENFDYSDFEIEDESI